MKKMKFMTFMLFTLTMAFTACTNVNEPDPEPTASLPVSETFETGIGNFTTQSVSGDQVWEFSSQYKYMSVSGYVAPTNFANEDWLISPEIDLSGVTAAKLSFEHVCRYFGDLKNEATVWVSENYIDGLPSTATWTQLTTKTFTDPGSWTLAPSGEISLTAYAGKKIKIGFKYLSTATKAGTWEIKNFLVEEGEATIDPNDLVSGEGTEASPYNIAAAIANQGSSKWVKGYIVGYIVFGTPTVYVFSSDTCTVKTNLLLAASKTETDLNNCMAVQLPSGAIQTGLNLSDNKTNIGKEVTLYGSLEAYFGKPGIKSVSYYALEGGATGGTKPADTSNAIFSESFATNQGAFTIQDVLLPEGGTFVWKWDTYKYMKASAFIGSAKASESWLISPAINLSGKTAATLSFEHTGKYFTANKLTEQSVYVSVNYSSGLPSTATWTQLTIPSWPTGNDWTLVSSGDINLSSVLGQANVRIAFKYASTTAGAATWEVKNVLIK